LGDKAAGRQVVDQGAVHLLVEIKVEAIQRAVWIAEAGLFVAALEQAILAPHEFVRHQQRDEIERREVLGLGVTQPRFEDIRHPGEPQLAERTIEFDEVHRGSPVLRSTRSR
jgi:hypothetical protein